MSRITGIEDKRSEGRATAPDSQLSAVPRLSFTEEPTRVWEVGEPVAFEIPDVRQEAALSGSSSRRSAHLPEGKRRVPVIGWRSWKLRRARDGVLLQSVFGSDCWEVGTTSARCRRWPLRMPASHWAVPGTSCECGLYAFSSATGAIDHAQRQLARVFAHCQQPSPVVGAVVGWGRVVQHGSQGWRAEYARPIALLNTGLTLIEEVTLCYGLRLVSMRGLCLLPLEYGEALGPA